MKNIENQEPRATSHNISSIRKYLYKKQLEFFDFLSSDPHEALELSRDTLNYVNQLLQIYPNDNYFQSVKGYLLKDEAQSLLKLDPISPNDFARIEETLDKARQVFDNILIERPNDETAWAGKGNVESLSNNHKRAIVYYDKALSINPHYSQAIHDRNLSLAYLSLASSRARFSGIVSTSHGRFSRSVQSTIEGKGFYRENRGFITKQEGQTSLLELCANQRIDETARQVL
jgi:tetratricopeptide (TPR) repeat protein